MGRVCSHHAPSPLPAELRTDRSEEQRRSSGKEKSNMKMECKGKEVAGMESSPEVRWKVIKSSDSVNPVDARQELPDWDKSNRLCRLCSDALPTPGLWSLWSRKIPGAEEESRDCQLPFNCSVETVCVWGETVCVLRIQLSPDGSD
ncbi:uncharacterized protein LOC127041341 isoform X3 [Gopherus flavomarginatus]|uniref:uncharacterized protein LOC127041341 isoform X3 n=1 Tax=Gopherus flavomarginatus TaxID=286002 RepID=UPI0021CBE82D|nr:uncharacterized protein LOC127041341 isoform X3 [Gopherus flavomarginatus]